MNLLLVRKTNLIYFVWQVTFQYALWDRFKALNSLSQVNRMNLCRLCAHLISSKALSLAVLRVSLCWLEIATTNAARNRLWLVA